MEMEGREVFRRAVRAMVDSSLRSLERAGVTPADVDLVVPHQANIRIIDAACQRLGIPIERTATVLQSTGNTSAASIPLALVDAIEDGRVHEGDLVLLVGFGAGMSWASAVLRWTAVSRVALRHRRRTGIGLATARRFAADGHRVAVTYRTAPPPPDADVLAVACDVTDAEQVDAAFEKVEEELGNVEILVSNAGITADMLVLRMSDDDFTSVIDTNLTGALPRGPSRRAADDAGPLGSDRLHRVGRRHHRSGRAGELRRRRRPG